MKQGSLYTVLIATVLAGCSIQQTVEPVSHIKGKEICVVVNPSVSQAGFLTTYMRSLSAKGFSVRQLPPGSPITDCTTTSTYTANWRWDLAMYMAYADIKVYNNGQQVGHAVYDALGGGANMGKFIKGETKIAELVNQLFPTPAGQTVE